MIIITYMNVYNKINNDIPHQAIRRLYKEDPLLHRSDYHRDRDRIMHSVAFRRLANKTQVFTSDKGDHYRNRLTHTLEVSQIARSLNLFIGGNEPLTEAIALSHDLGHPPFGHAGEDVLDNIMSDDQGFDHNIQTYRIITKIEKRYANFNGLNLTTDTLEGVLKHNGPIDIEVIKSKLFYSRLNEEEKLDLTSQPSLEAQIASISDDIAYNCHDLDDGIRAGFFTINDLKDISIINQILDKNTIKFGTMDNNIKVYEMIRSLINHLIHDVVDESARRIEKSNITKYTDIGRSKDTIVNFSEKLNVEIIKIKNFLYKNMYKNKNVLDNSEYGKIALERLFEFYSKNPNFLPDNWFNSYGVNNKSNNRLICDFIACMSDSFAIKQFNNL